jgi:quercetin dioxygenase-like cupin family protein
LRIFFCYKGSTESELMMKEQHTTFGRYDQATPVAAAPGITRRALLTGSAMMVCEFRLDAGAKIPEHSHPHEQIGYVVSGRLRITVANQSHELGPGDTYWAPANVPHSARIMEAAVVVDTFSPPREDYRPGA